MAGEPRARKYTRVLRAGTEIHTYGGARAYKLISGFIPRICAFSTFIADRNFSALRAATAFHKLLFGIDIQDAAAGIISLLLRTR